MINVRYRHIYKWSLVVLFLLITLLALWLYQNYVKVIWTEAKFEESAEPLSNPYQGWYNIYGYTLSEGAAYTTKSVLAGNAYDTENQMALLEINLKNYRQINLSDTALKQLDLILSAWEQTDKKLILRFLYDWDGKATLTEPDELSLILKHMSQLAPVINAYSTLIFTLQGIFVGNVGEMHDSNHLSEESTLKLIQHLAEVTDPSIFLSVRTPAYWRLIASSFAPLSKEASFSGSIPARTGLFNDGMLGSGNDCGTYGDLPLSQSTSYSDKALRLDELAFQKQLCAYVPSGGEVIIDNSYNDLSAAIHDFYQMHVTYLNSMYDPAVLNKWKSTIYEGQDVFHGCSGYNYIGMHLGYRYVLRSAGLSYRPFLDKAATLTINIENVGFANCYKDFRVKLLLQNTDQGTLQELYVPTDSRTWLSSQSTQVTVPIDFRLYDKGNYQIYLSVTDPSTNKPIYFANQQESNLPGYLLGSLTFHKLTKQ